MLKKIEISNFKNFNEKFTFDLSNTSNYNFNPECVQNGIVNTGIIYGQNGCGKSNLGLAIFDMVSHLTDNSFRKSKYENYLNADNTENKASFRSTFLLNDIEVIYEYSKKDYQTLISEKLTIDNKEIFSIDREKSTKFKVEMEGAETLKTDVGDSNISIISYIENNSILNKNLINKTFNDFNTFIRGMLFSKTLDENIYMGYEQGIQYIDDYIVTQGKLKNFEDFLNIVENTKYEDVNCYFISDELNQDELNQVKFIDEWVE